MKVRNTILAVLLCGSALIAQAATPLPSAYKNLRGDWFAPNTTYPLCSASVTTYCLNSYTFTATDPNGGNTILSVPTGGILPGGAMFYVYTPGGFLYCGPWAVAVTANYLDGTGAGVSATPVSTTATAPCPLTASPATSLKVTFQP